MNEPGLQAKKSLFEKPLFWFVALPACIAAAYWLFFISLNAVWQWRIPALPKVFFDEPMYMAVLAKDLFHGFHIIPPLARPFLLVGKLLAPFLSLSELYALGVITSVILSLWLTAVLIRQMSGVSLATARSRALLLILIGNIVLAFRPGGSSWYVPFFLAALIGLVFAERNASSGRWVRACAWSTSAVVISSVYPWYFGTIVAGLGILFLWHVYRPAYLWILLAGGALLTSVALWQQQAILKFLTTSYSVLLALYGGIMISHLTVISNTLIAIALWIALWAFAAKHASSEHAWISRMMTALWATQLILWLQPIVTGLSIVPDHFIYSTWILSAISFVVWPTTVVHRLQKSSIPLWIRVTGIFALFFVVYIHVELLLKKYSWFDYPSLVIHIVIWLFLAAAIFGLMYPKAVMRTLIGCAIFIIATSFVGVSVKAYGQRASIAEIEGVRAWISSQPLDPSLNWCSDIGTNDYLFASTGATFHPTVAERHDPVWYPVFLNRRIEQAAFFNPEAAGELFEWDDTFLHGLAINCSVAAPAKAFVESLPLSQQTKNFITGCDDAWMSSVVSDTEAKMRERWQQPVPMSSALCDRFVVRKRLKDDWRIPISYKLLYEDVNTQVYGKR